MTTTIRVRWIEHAQAITITVDQVEDAYAEDSRIVINDIVEPNLTALLLSGLKAWQHQRTIAPNGMDYEDTYIIDNPDSNKVVLKGHPITHPHVANTEQWIVGTLDDIISNNINHYTPRVAQLMRQVNECVKTYKSACL